MPRRVLGYLVSLAGLLFTLRGICAYLCIVSYHAACVFVLVPVGNLSFFGHVTCERGVLVWLGRSHMCRMSGVLASLTLRVLLRCDIWSVLSVSVCVIMLAPAPVSTGTYCAQLDILF